MLPFRRNSGTNPLEKQLDPWVQLLLKGGPYDPMCNKLLTKNIIWTPSDGVFWIRACNKSYEWMAYPCDNLQTKSPVCETLRP